MPFNDINQSRLDDFDMTTCIVCKCRELKMATVGAYGRSQRCSLPNKEGDPLKGATHLVVACISNEH